ncbi:MAG: phosphatase PAP2 family protein [Spirochaetales bacterium]
MNSIFSWGLTLIRSIQELLGPGMLAPMKVITFFGTEIFALAALPLIYWCVDRRKGARLGVVILFSAFLNLWVKMLFMQPRPYDFDASVGLAREPTPGFPSGHSQTSMTFWGMMLTIAHGPWRIATFVAIPLLVGLSRMYLGVHFPTDVLGGWLLGGLVLGLFYGFGKKIEAMMAKWNLRLRIIAIAIVALGMNMLMRDDTRLSGVFFGSGVGFALASGNLRFDAAGDFLKRGLRYVLGLAGTLILYLGPKALLGDTIASQQALINFLRYGLIGIWVAYGAPWCFIKLKPLSMEQGETEKMIGDAKGN